VLKAHDSSVIALGCLQGAWLNGLTCQYQVGIFGLLNVSYGWYNGCRCCHDLIVTCCYRFVFFKLYSLTIQVIDLGDNGIADTDGTLLESLAHLPLKHTSLTKINLGGKNEIKAAAFLVESLCNVNKSQAAYPVHCLCEKISLL
jgi:hypothetical protein